MDSRVPNRRTFSGGRLYRGPNPPGSVPVKVEPAYIPNVPIPTNPTITAITLTGDRHIPFALCEKWMRQQTRRADQWIVVDDGFNPIAPTHGMQYVRRERRSDDPRHTLVPNFKAALPLIKGSKVIIIEDDDYYAPEYIEEISRQLDKYEVVGLGNAKYYHLPTGGYHQVGNTRHASLSETAFRSSYLPDLLRILNLSNEPYVDMQIWKGLGTRGHVFFDNEKSLFVGMKGLPGRDGIGSGHSPKMYHGHVDTGDRAVLKNWAPKDYQAYMDILNRKLTEANCRLYYTADSLITGISVCWNTKSLIERAYASVRRFHPLMPIIIIDGSDAGDPCMSYVRGLASPITTPVSLGYNIGHGRGMCKGIDMVKTPYALIFDSDIEMLKSPVQAMFEMMEPDTFAVGYIEKTGYDGYTYGVHPNHAREGWMPMIHPYFHLINIANYRKYYPYVHHGAPCYLTALSIYKKGLSNRVIKEFPGLGHTLGTGPNWDSEPRIVKEYIRHDIRGTCKVRKQKFREPIEGGWVMNRGLV